MGKEERAVWQGYSSDKAVTIRRGTYGFAAGPTFRRSAQVSASIWTNVCLWGLVIKGREGQSIAGG